MADSNTVENSTKPKRKGQFEKGDARINRGGRPKSFDALRKLAQGVACEIAIDPKTKGPLTIKTLVLVNGEVDEREHILTVGEAILRSWAHDPKRQIPFIETAYGKVPLSVGVGGQVEHVHRLIIVEENANDSARSPDSVEDTDTGAEAD